MAHPFVSACASVSFGSHLEVCDLSSKEAEKATEEKGTIRSVLSVSASFEHLLVFFSSFSWFTLERKDSYVFASVFVSASVDSVNQALVFMFLLLCYCYCSFSFFSFFTDPSSRLSYCPSSYLYCSSCPFPFPFHTMFAFIFLVVFNIPPIPTFAPVAVPLLHFCPCYVTVSNSI